MAGYHLMTDEDHSIQLGALGAAMTPQAGARQHPGGSLNSLKTFLD